MWPHKIAAQSTPSAQVALGGSGALGVGLVFAMFQGRMIFFQWAFLAILAVCAVLFLVLVTKLFLQRFKGALLAEARSVREDEELWVRSTPGARAAAMAIGIGERALHVVSGAGIAMLLIAISMKLIIR